MSVAYALSRENDSLFSAIPRDIIGIIGDFESHRPPLRLRIVYKLHAIVAAVGGPWCLGQSNYHAILTNCDDLSERPIPLGSYPMLSPGQLIEQVYGTMSVTDSARDLSDDCRCLIYMHGKVYDVGKGQCTSSSCTITYIREMYDEYNSCITAQQCADTFKKYSEFGSICYESRWIVEVRDAIVCVNAPRQTFVSVDGGFTFMLAKCAGLVSGDTVYTDANTVYYKGAKYTVDAPAEIVGILGGSDNHVVGRDRECNYYMLSVKR